MIGQSQRLMSTLGLVSHATSGQIKSGEVVPLKMCLLSKSSLWRNYSIYDFSFFDGCDWC